jgi:hypothetical protein
MADLRCPGCGESTDLRGRRGESGIRITCGSCGLEWDRDARRRCANCGGDDIVLRPQTLTAFSRGTQLSILGWRELPLCAVCDRGELMRSTDGAAPIAPDYVPAAMEPRTS